MSKYLAELKQRLPRVKPWIAVAVILAVTLAGYYFVLGTRYLKASGEVISIEEQIRLQTRILRQQIPDEVALKAERASGEHRLKELRTLFTYSETGVLMGILSDTADDALVGMDRIELVDTRMETLGGIQYQTVPVTTTVRGDTLDIYQFLSLLQQKVPGASVSDITLSGLDGSPKAQAPAPLLPAT